MTTVLESYYALDKPMRRLVRRAAFGDPAALAILPQEAKEVYLGELRQLLIEENERTGTFPEKWTDQSGEEDE